jgi:hypothetical protein
VRVRVPRALAAMPPAAGAPPPGAPPARARASPRPSRAHAARLATCAAALACALLAAAPRHAAAQLKFDQMDGAEYITYCAEVASTQILTPACSDGYATLQGVVTSLLAAPSNFTRAQLGALNGLCATSQGPSCMAQMQNLAELYVDGLPPPPPGAAGKDTCEGTLAPNANALFSTTLPFVCLADGAGGSCLVEVAKALEKAGAWRALGGWAGGGSALGGCATAAARVLRAFRAQHPEERAARKTPLPRAQRAAPRPRAAAHTHPRAHSPRPRRAAPPRTLRPQHTRARAPHLPP